MGAFPGVLIITKGEPVPDQAKHAAQIDAWMKRLPEHLESEQLASAFEQVFRALWRRTQVPLGYVTVSAIVDRVLHDTSKHYPVLAALKTEGESGVQFGDFQKSVTAGDGQQVRDGMRFFLLRLLTVLGNLTGQILTPALYSELDKVTLDDLAATRQPLDRGGSER
jgi:hypothetical protein